MKIINVKQRSPEWYALRKEKIGASDAAKIMGLSPFGSPISVFKEKKGLAEPFVSKAMLAGMELEEEARRSFEQELNVEMFDLVGVHSDLDWQLASFDGITLARDAAVEIKCPGEVSHQIALRDEIPSYYMPQLQHQMNVAGLESIFYYSYRNGSGKIIEVMRDQSFIDTMNEIEMKFWEDWQNGIFPQNAIPGLKDMNESDVWKIESQDFYDDYQLHKILESRLEARKNVLRESAGNESCTGFGIKFTKHDEKGRIDYSKIPELKGVDTEQYRKPPFTKWRTSFIS